MTVLSLLLQNYRTIVRNLITTAAVIMDIMVNGILIKLNSGLRQQFVAGYSVFTANRLHSWHTRRAFECRLGHVMCGRNILLSCAISQVN